MAKRKTSRNERLIITGFIATVLLVIGGFYMSTQKAPTGLEVTGGAVTPTGETADIGGLITATACSGDANPTVRTIGTNPLNTITTDYTSGATGHFRQIGSELIQLDVTYSGATQATNANAICGKSYDLVIETNQDTTNGIYLAAPFQGETSIVPAGGSTATVEVTNVTLLQARLFNVFEDSFMYDNSDADEKDFEALGSSLNFTSVTNNETATAIGADEGTKAHWILYVEGINKYGEFGMESYVCYDLADDSNANDWSVPDFVKFNGQSMAEMKGQITGDDNAQLVTYEYCYKLPQTLGKGNTDAIEFKVPTGSGVNADKDIGIKIVATGITESSESQNKYLGLTALDGNNMFDDSSSNSEIVTATAQLVNIAID